MSYDLYVVPADACADHTSIEAHVDSQTGQPPEAVAAGIAAAISARNSPDDDERAFLSIHPLQAEGDVVSVPILFSHVQVARDAVIQEAFEAGFGVYDPQNLMVIDLQKAVGMSVESSSDRNFPTVTADMLSVLAHRMRDKDHLIVELDDHYYIQSQRRGEKYDVEFRAGSADRHYGLEASSAADVARTMGLWITREFDELRDLPWTKVDL